MSNIIPFPSVADGPMVKLIHINDQDELSKAAGVLVHFIDTESLIKSASSSAISKKMIDENLPTDQYWAAHLIAMGASETYGFNKNGDFWTRAGLEHPGKDYGYETFVKYGHFFREHENDDPKKAIGLIKAAAWNKPMDRVELIIWGDKDKSAEEYELAKRGKLLSFSMSARVPEDFCSICGHAAKSSKFYCVHAKKHMTQWMPKFSKFAYVINKRPKFFDISRVKNPADRIAHYLEYMLDQHADLQKAASAGDFVFSDMMAKAAGVRALEVPTLGIADYRGQEWLEKLGAFETMLLDVQRNPRACGSSAAVEFCKIAHLAFGDTAVTDAQLAVFRKMEPDVLWYHLAKKATVLPFDAFAALSTKQTVAQTAADVSVKYAKTLLPNAINAVMDEPADAGLEALFKVADAVKVAASNYEEPILPTLNALAYSHSLDKGDVRSRTLHNCAKGSSTPLEKFAGVATEEVMTKAKNLVRAYALYKVALCQALSDLHGEEFVDDATQILISSQK